jgi:hypothetical protein
MWEWILLLALIVFFMYMWTAPPKVSTSGGCNTCAKKKNVVAVE